ncbi:DUF1963 domain-containing protein [Actinosynnema sp. NPDC059797]
MCSPGPGDEIAGQAGGLPRLPVGVEWPSSGKGVPLPFIASVDCAALPRAEGLPLPADGSLLFFLHHEEDHLACLGTGEPEFARVLYVPAGAETVVATPPPDHENLRPYHQDIPFLIPEHRLSARVEPALPEWIEERDERDAEFESETVQRLLEELEHLDELCEVVDDLWPGTGPGGAISLGGHCSEIGGQDPPFTQLALFNLKDRFAAEPDLPRAEKHRLENEEEDRLTREWVPLVQFSTESEVYYGCFLISLDDLAAKRFDRARSFTMFTE